MEGISFPEQTLTLGRPPSMSEEECGPLPVYLTAEGQVISCWRMTLRERFSALIFGKVWLWVWSGKTQPPVALEVKRTVFKKEEA